MSRFSTHTSLSPLLARQLESACNAFEKAWHAGQQPRLEDFLEQSPEPACRELLRALLRLELALREHGGEPVACEMYERRFPQHATLIRELFQQQAHTIDAGAATPSRQANADPDLKLPSLKNYELLGELGRGGMGVVYKARDRRLNRLVALKMILAGPHAGQADVVRFRTEAEAVARLQHPNIVQVYEIGEHEHGQYLSLEYCSGGSLANRLDGTPLQPDAAARLIETLARAMQAAHDAQVIHRDLKPANVLLNEKDAPKISDFGLAKKLDDLSGQTHTGQVMGTPSYMAPEQAAGRKDIGKAIDVYALGAILYQMLTGRPPFKGPTPIDTLAQVLADEPIPPSRLQPKTPRDLETICLKCLQKDPGKRYESASALAEDLHRFLSHEPISARPSARLERAWRWCRRKPALAAAIGLGVFALVAAICLPVGWLFLLEQTRAAERLRQEQKQTRSALGQAQQQRKIADAQGLLATKYRRQAERLASEIALDRGAALCEQGEATEGLFWLTRALHALPEDEAELERLVRLRLAAWHRQAHPLRMRFHVGDTSCKSAVSHNGRVVLTGHADNMARLWDAMTGKPLGPPLAHPAPISAVALSPDGRIALTGARDDRVRLWEAATGKPVGPVLSYPAVFRAKFSADGQKAVTVSENLTAQIWDVTSRQPIGPPLVVRAGSTIIPGEKKIELSPSGAYVLMYKERVAELRETATGKQIAALEHKDLIRAGIFSPDGKLLVTGGKDRVAQLWETATGKPIGPALLHQGVLQHVAFSPDGKTLATCAAERGYLWDVPSLLPLSSEGKGLAVKSVGVSLEDRGGVRELHFSPDGRLLLSHGLDQKLRLWDVGAGKRLGGTLDPQGPSQISFARDGQSFVALSSSGTVNTWDISSCQPSSVVLRHKGAVNTVAFSADKRTVLTGSVDRTAQMWDAETGERLGPPLQCQGRVECTRFSPDGKLALTSSDDGVVRLWEVATGQPFGPPLVHKTSRMSGRFSPDGRLVLTVGRNGLAQFWDVATGQPRGSPMQHTGPLGPHVFSPDGRFVLIAGLDRTAHLWEVATCKQVAAPLQHSDVVLCLAFSPDSRTMLTGCRDGAARLWEVPTARPLLPPVKHPYVVPCALFSRDGKLVLSGGGSGVLQLWETATGKPVGAPLVHAQHVTYAVFNEGGDLILSASQYGSPYLWETQTGKMLGPPLPQTNHADIVRTGFDTAAISPDGRMALTAGDDGVARLWKLPVPVAGTREDIALWIRVLAGLEMAENGMPRVMDAASWQRDHDRLDEIGGPPLRTDGRVCLPLASKSPGP